MSFQETVAQVWTNLNNSLGSALPIILLAFIFIVGAGLLFIIFIVKKYDYDVFIVSKNGIGGGYKQVQGIKKGNNKTGFSLQLTKIKRKIEMVNEEYIIPSTDAKHKPVIWLEEDGYGNLNPIRLADDKGEIVMYPTTSEDKFWYINEMKKKDEFIKIANGLKDVINGLVILILAICFIFFLIYMNKTAVEQTRIAFEGNTQMASHQAQIAEDNRKAAENYAATNRMFVDLFGKWAKAQGINLGIDIPEQVVIPVD